MTDKILKGRVTLVTGASRGIGYWGALALAKAGSHIIALGRTQGGLEDLDDAIKAEGGEASLVPFDLKAPEGLSQLAGIVAQRWGRLDGLFACAGALGEITLTAQIDPKTFEDTLAVNLTANMHLIREFDPLLKASGSGRALFMTSSVGSLSSRAYWGSYAASKAGLDALVRCYAKEVEQTNLKVNLLNPGATRTAMRAKAYPGEALETNPHPKAITPLITDLLSPNCQNHDEIVSYREWVKAQGA